MIMPSAPTVKKNGAKGGIETVELAVEARLDLLRAADRYFQDNWFTQRAEKQRQAHELAQSGMFAITHIASVLGTTAKTLRRWGVDVPGNRKGGAFSPAQLEHVTVALDAHHTTGTYDAQHIRKAYENGMSAPVLARLMGLSRKYVLQLVRKAQDGWHMEPREAEPGREDDRGTGLDESLRAEIAAAYGLEDSDLTAYEWDVMARTLRGDFDDDKIHIVDEDESDTVDESGAAEDEAGRTECADDGAEDGAQVGAAGTQPSAQRGTPAGEQPD